MTTWAWSEDSGGEQIREREEAVGAQWESSGHRASGERASPDSSHRTEGSGKEATREGRQ